MNRIAFYLILLFCLSFSTSWSQLSLKSINGNLAYLGADNKLIFNTTDSLTFNSTNGKVIKGKNQHYFYVPENIGTGQVNVKNEIDGSSLVLFFRIYNFPLPLAMLEFDNVLPRKDNKYIDRNLYSKEQIKKFPNVVLLLNNFDINVRLTVKQYVLFYKSGKKKIKQIKVEGLSFYRDEEVKKIIDNCKSGDIFMINEILTKNNVNDKEQWIPSIYFIVE